MVHGDEMVDVRTFESHKETDCNRMIGNRELELVNPHAQFLVHFHLYKLDSGQHLIQKRPRAHRFDRELAVQVRSCPNAHLENANGNIK